MVALSGSRFNRVLEALRRSSFADRVGGDRPGHVIRGRLFNDPWRSETHTRYPMAMKGSLESSMSRVLRFANEQQGAMIEAAVIDGALSGVTLLALGVALIVVARRRGGEALRHRERQGGRRR